MGRRKLFKKIAHPLQPIRHTLDTSVNLANATGQLVTHPGDADKIVTGLLKNEINDKKQELQELKEVVHDTTIVAKSTIHGGVRGYQVGELFFPSKDGIIISTVVGAAVGFSKGVIKVAKESDEEHKKSAHSTESQTLTEEDMPAVPGTLDGIEGYQIGEYFFYKTQGIMIGPGNAEYSMSSWSPKMFGGQPNNNNNNNNNNIASSVSSFTQIEQNFIP